ncbi:hypothetical protein M9H77_22842 [Catharanthus roseus]|uniref:Uncharacterized protein n=1 Tax=Catharanthus roseus TaxID=4058 RepID=A0ACC0ARK7_CATRO|nr:hypothetical protein M9H77_22842 [Catharanthus roseus]
MIIEKSFGEEVIEHFRLKNIFRVLGWVPLLHLSGSSYNISHVKGVRFVLERGRLTSILGISDNRNTVTMYSNRRSIDENLDWNFDVTCSHCNIQHKALDRRRIIHGGDFPSLLPRAHTYFFEKGVDSPSEEDRLWDCSASGFRPIKKTTQSGIRTLSSEPVEDDDDEDKASAQNTIPIDAFQTGMQTVFEQLRINQEIQEIQLTERVESTRRYVDALAHQRASIDRQEVMLAYCATNSCLIR